MLKIFSLLFIAYSAILCAESCELDNQSNKLIDHFKDEVPPLLNEDKFVVFYAFSEEFLRALLKEAMIRSFNKIGKVYLADDSQLSAQQKKDKYEIGGSMLHVIATPIVEENLSLTSNRKYKVMPILELSLEVTGAVKSVTNNRQFCCPIWKKQMFINASVDKKEFVQKAIESLETILNKFIIDYQNANPGKKPEFFLYA